MSNYYLNKDFEYSRMADAYDPFMELRVRYDTESRCGLDYSDKSTLLGKLKKFLLGK